MLGIVSQLAVLMIPVGFGYFMYRSEQAERAQQAQVQQAEEASRSALFARGNLGEGLKLCRDGWSNLGFSYQEPVALAWSRKGLFAYFHQGSDPSSLRQLRCEAGGGSLGPRFDHPLHAQLPAEAPTTSEQEASSGDWNRAVLDASARPLESAELGVELLRHPVTGRVLTRRWKAGAGGAVATVEPADAPAFASLLPAGQIGAVAASAATPLQPLGRHRWAAETEGAFALLMKEMPKGARVSELHVEDDKIELQIQHPTPNAEGPPAPYGDKTFDEYGVADNDWWYPRTETGFGCASGTPLADVHAKFLAASSSGQRLAWAWFSCSTAYSNGREGVWHVVLASGH
jgi:hypothetical protein